MWRKTSVVLALAFALLARTEDTSAQTRDGFWFGAGGGYGAAQTCYEGGCGERKDSGVGYVQGGYTLNDHLRVGGEFGLWSKKYPYPMAGDYSRVTMYSLTATATYYPNRTRGLFVKGGAGVAFIDSYVKAYGSTVEPDLGKGLGLVVGGGYDISVGPVAISPAFNYWYGRLGDIKTETGASTYSVVINHRQNIMALTVGITIP